MTDEDRRLPSYEEEEAAPQTVQEWAARYRWVTPEQAAEYVEAGARERRLVARTAAEAGPTRGGRTRSNASGCSRRSPGR